ncbi:MAG: diadenylate cyclase CdaA [Eubacterium sp.]|nr:diadenylate cyclase CdaA [Eubacterium sp.]
MEAIKSFFRDYVAWLSMPDINIVDIIEILVIAFAVYQIIIWIKDTRAWVLLKGIIILVLVWLIALVLNMNALLWIFQNAMVIGITAIVIIFQPEFRNALEKLGRKSFASLATPFEGDKYRNEKYSQKSIDSVIKAVYAMAKEKTGAIIVVEKDIQCREVELTGIPLDATISSQLLINIFEDKTPLHDGAVILRNDRIVAATCYLPLSNSMKISKDLGTRHRAGLGVSEVSDSITIIVSEETGGVSVAQEGKLRRWIEEDELRKILRKVSPRRSKAKGDYGKGGV